MAQLSSVIPVQFIRWCRYSECKSINHAANTVAFFQLPNIFSVVITLISGVVALGGRRERISSEINLEHYNNTICSESLTSHSALGEYFSYFFVFPPFPSLLYEYGPRILKLKQINGFFGVIYHVLFISLLFLPGNGLLSLRMCWSNGVPPFITANETKKDV